MATATMQFTETQRSRHLDFAIAEWSHNGWLVVSRAPLTVQLKKQRSSLVPPLLLILVACIVAAIPLYALVTREQLFLGIAALFVVGTVLIVAGWASMRDKLVYLTISADGEVKEH